MLRKSGILMISLLLVFLSSTGFSFTWNSFRNQSTAGLLDDDYDLLLDPARLPLIEGSRLYTSLANLVDKQEGVFSNADNGCYLIGGSSTLGEKASPGLVHDRYSLRTSLPFDLVTIGGTPVSFFGEGELVDTRFTDEDGDGRYDRKETQHQTAEGWDQDLSSDYYVAVGTDLDVARVGLFYLFSDGSYELVDAGENFTLTKTDTNLINGECTYSDDQVAAGDALDETSSHQFGLATWIPAGENLILGANFAYAMRSMDFNHTWDFDQTEDNSPDQPEVDTYVQDEGSIETVPSSGSMLSGALRGIYNWTEDVETWLDLTLAQFSREIDAGAGRDYRLFAESRTTLGAGEEVSTDTNRTTAVISGDYSENNLGVFTRTIARLSEKVTFGIGFGLGTGNWESTDTDNASRLDEYLYDDGDTQANDPDDYTETVVDTLIETIETTGSDFTVGFPVGVEFQIKNPLVLRLGARHDIGVTDMTTTTTRTVSAEHHRVERGDGTWDEWIDPPVSEPINGRSETVKRKMSQTNYYYGLGYKVTNNLQIDLMGFSDLTDLSNWRLSAVFAF